ncbi:isopentenyl-diphosphate Delta-isomerase I-like [Papaver somniferum]|uniref:isopentenyl-diphosphate Delta-isomerase I-like n=1 Tax=Papaver somniferum TaxID=3469 RepID=UPI000E6F62C6|nr:isopentenyl-diphosphate Delta-isomerase I-like [Papaver somniferum]
MSAAINTVIFATTTKLIAKSTAPLKPCNRFLFNSPSSSLIKTTSFPISATTIPCYNSGIGLNRSIFRAFSSSSSAVNNTMADVSDSSMDAVQRRLMFEDECILVDENDNVVGHDSKYNCHLMEKIESENLLHRAFSVFLFNPKYELLLQQRSATKVTFPLVWTNACCSHPLYRESELIEENYLGVRNAAQRKLLDELGIPAEDVPVDEFTPLGRILYKAPSDGKWGEHELDYLLFIVRDVKMHPNPDEVADVKYVNREELKDLVKKADAGEVKLSPWFRLVVDNFLFKWWDQVEQGTLQEAVDMKTIHKLT